MSSICGASKYESVPRESVIQTKTKNEVQLQEYDASADEDILSHIKAEEIEIKENHTSDQGLIFKYIHKKFNTKKRNRTGKIKVENIPQIIEDPIEGTSKEREPFNT